MAVQLFLLVYKWIAARPYATTNQRRVPCSIFFSSPCCSTQVSMQTTGFHTRLLKRIDILVAICSGGKENKNLSPHNVSPHNIIAAYSSLWLKSARWCCHFYPCVRFYKHHLARLYPKYGSSMTGRWPGTSAGLWPSI